MKTILRNAAVGGSTRVAALYRRLANLLQFQLEQFLLRGAVSRLLVIAFAIGLLSVTAGLAVFYGVGGFKAPADSIWWAFLHLTDPGYLGDDKGALLRVISGTITVAGVVLFMGALIAIITQWLDQTIARLEQGFTPIAQNNHVLILGWTNHTAAMVAQLLEAEGRVKRFLRRHHAGRLRIVILAERVGPALVQELKDRLAGRWKPRQVILRSGSPLRLEHLLRVDYQHAAVILLPAQEFGSGYSTPDERTVKTLMSAAHSELAAPPEQLPLLVAELFDADQLGAARRAYPGPAELIGSGLMISRLIAHSTRHQGLTRVYTHLLSGAGDQVFIREFPELEGEALAALAPGFDKAVLLGAVRHEGRHFEALYAHPDYRLQPEDKLALIATGYDACSVTSGFEPGAAIAPSRDYDRERGVAARRVLVLGWNLKVPALIQEIDAYAGEASEVDVLSLVEIAERQRILARKGVEAVHARVRQLEGDLTSRRDLTALEPGTYDNIVLVASDWLESAEAADARTLLGYLVLAEVLEAAGKAPPVLVEAMAADNTGFFVAPNVELLVSPDLQTHMLTQVALRRELHWVLDELCGASGAEIALRRQHEAGLADFGGASFNQLQAALADQGEILLGVMRANGELHLNPAPKDTPLALGDDDELVVLDVV